MSTSAVTPSLNQQIHQYFQTRQSDLQQLGQDLQSGNLTAAQSDVSTIVNLGKSGPLPNGEAFLVPQRQQDFNNIGQDLQNNDLAGAQQAFATLQSSFEKQNLDPPASPSAAPAAVSAPANAAPEIVVNLNGAGSTVSQSAASTAGTAPEIVLNVASGNSSTPEQITINLSNSSSGGEQVALSIGNQGSNAQQVTFNLGSNSNEQIVLNLLSATSATAGSTTGSASGTGLSVSA